MYQQPTAPRTIGGVLDDSFRLYRASARRWWLPSLLLALISAAAGLYLGLRLGLNPTPAMMLSLYKSPSMLAFFGVRVLIAIWLYFTIMASIAAVATGADLPFPEAARKGLQRLPAIIGGGILYTLAFCAATLLLIIPGIYVFGRLQFWLAALVLEESGPIEALRASWTRVKGHWWRTFTILAVLLIMLLVMWLLIGAVAGVLIVIARPGSIVLIAVMQSVAGLLSIVITPVFPAALVATYLDLKLRAEGGDLEARMKDLPTG